MCSLRNALVISSAIGVAVLLHGCGGGGDGGGSDTKTTTTTGSATTTFIKPRSKPMTSAEAANHLNKLYNGFNKDDDTSPLGVTISMAAQPASYFANQYCSHFFNPHIKKFTSCFKGQADCRMSAANIGHQWMLDHKTGGVASFGNRGSGYIFNQTMTEKRWTKCAFIWDGASANNYNRGCGIGAPGNDCSESKTAWDNICPSTGKTCTADDTEVKQAMCTTVAGGETPPPPTHDGHPQCYFPGAAINFHGQAGFNFGEDHTREMLKTRVAFTNNSFPEKSTPNIQENNEIVIDEELLIPDYWEDPVAAIPAFVYTKSNAAIAKGQAAEIRDEFCNYYGCELNGGGKIPLVMIDDTQKLESGPFLAADEESALVV